MFAVVLGLVAVAVIAYEYFKETPATSLPPGLRMGLSNLPAADPTLATKCGLLATDFHDADVWSATYLGKSLALNQRLVLMRSVFAYPTWPGYAVRSDCVLNPTVAPPPLAQSNRPTHWQGP